MLYSKPDLPMLRLSLGKSSYRTSTSESADPSQDNTTSSDSLSAYKTTTMSIGLFPSAESAFSILDMVDGLQIVEDRQFGVPHLVLLHPLRSRTYDSTQVDLEQNTPSLHRYS